MTEIEKSAFFRDLTGTPDFPEAEVVADIDIDLCPGCDMGVVDDLHYAPDGVAWHGECWRHTALGFVPEVGQEETPTSTGTAADLRNDDQWCCGTCEAIARAASSEEEQ